MAESNAELSASKERLVSSFDNFEHNRQPQPQELCANQQPHIDSLCERKNPTPRKDESHIHIERQELR
jgi:hypothetical protein